MLQHLRRQNLPSAELVVDGKHLPLSDEAVTALHSIVRRNGLDILGAIEQAVRNEEIVEDILQSGDTLLLA